MNFKELCEARHSVRSYSAQVVDEEKLQYVLECARLAPSAVNKQPWRLHLLTKKDDLSKLVQCYNRPWMATAPAAIVVSAKHDEAWKRPADGKYHGDIDAAIIAEHICLAATEQGLGTCWVCNFDAPLCHQLLAMEADEEPVVIIPIGYAAEESVHAKQRKALDEILLRK